MPTVGKSVRAQLLVIGIESGAVSPAQANAPTPLHVEFVDEGTPEGSAGRGGRTHVDRRVIRRAEHPIAAPVEVVPQEGRFRNAHGASIAAVGGTVAAIVDGKRVAEREGFEPSMGCPIPHFQCGALGL